MLNPLLIGCIPVENRVSAGRRNSFIDAGDSSGSDLSQVEAADYTCGSDRHSIGITHAELSRNCAPLLPNAAAVRIDGLQYLVAGGSQACYARRLVLHDLRDCAGCASRKVEVAAINSADRM